METNKTGFKKRLDIKKAEFQTLKERMAFLEGVGWMLEQK